MAAHRVLSVVRPVMCGVPFLTGVVYAANDPDNKRNNVMKAYQLPIYGAATQLPAVDTDCNDPTSIEKNISTVRKQVWDYMDSTKETRENVSQKVATAKSHTMSLLHFIQDDPGYLSRAGVITIAGLGGIVAGYKGGALRKGFYALTGMAGAAAVCYPDQALDISKQGYKKVVNHTKEMWRAPGAIKVSTQNKETSPTTAQSTEKSAGETKATKPVDKNLEDHGQSKVEDKDMYTTRS